jgi:glycosyltransferase involved in cell wall biosynthesis
MIAVVVPAHNEAQLIAACIESILTAATCSELKNEAVRVIVVCDECTDATEAIATKLGADTIRLTGRNVGKARACGTEVALQAGARWLAFTDADTVVSPQWLSAQLELGADAVCGTIGVEQWAAYGSRMRKHFSLTYTDRDGHRHIHGANLGVSARAYRQAGGFQDMASGEDVALVNALIDSGATIAWSAAPRVTTSAREDFRAPGGFGAILNHIEQHGLWAGASPSA